MGLAHIDMILSTLISVNVRPIWDCYINSIIHMHAMVHGEHRTNTCPTPAGGGSPHPSSASTFGSVVVEDDQMKNKPYQ